MPTLTNRGTNTATGKRKPRSRFGKFAEVWCRWFDYRSQNAKRARAMVLWFAREAHDTMVRTWIDVHQRTAYAHKHTLDSLLSTLLGMTSKDMIVDRSWIVSPTRTDNCARAQTPRSPRANHSAIKTRLVITFRRFDATGAILVFHLAHARPFAADKILSARSRSSTFDWPFVLRCA